jgi:hypothetical protein
MKRIFKIICIVFFCTPCLCLIAQHSVITHTLTTCMNYYSSHPNLSFDMYYKMYDSHTSSKLIHQIDGAIKTSSGNVYVKMGGQLQILTSRYAIVTDEATKTMVVQERLAEQKSKTPLGIDSLVGLFAETSVLAETDELITLAFSKPKANFYTVSKFTVDIEKKSGKVKKAVLFYAFDLDDFYDEYETSTVPRIEILYENYMESFSAPEDMFSSASFFSLQNEKIAPVKNYQNYRLIDLRSLAKNTY